MNAFDLIDATVLPIDFDGKVTEPGKYLIERADGEFVLVAGDRKTGNCRGSGMVGVCMFKSSVIRYCDISRNWACCLKFSPIKGE